ncbi:MAG: virulence factor family protein [Steroidobacteraceae bacterium]
MIAVAATLLLIGRSSLPGAGAPGAEAPGATWTPVTDQQLAHGRFPKVPVFIPHGTPRGFVLLLSGAAGWTPGMAAYARRLAGVGAMVAGIDTATFNATLDADDGQCVYPDGDFENLSRFVQAYFNLPGYLPPILGGYEDGGTLAYAILAQAPPATFAAAVSVDFCPSYSLRKPLCKSAVLDYKPLSTSLGVEFLPAPALPSPWVVLQQRPRRESLQRCVLASVVDFVDKVTPAQLTQLPPALDDEKGQPRWRPADEQAFSSLMVRNAPSGTAITPHELHDLPLITVEAAHGTAPADTFAIMLSGDGGWAGIDKDIAAALAAQGMTVIGFDSLRYFWGARTPAGLAVDLSRIIDFYTTRLHLQRVILLGYSQGADVLPFAASRLPAATRSKVILWAMMGISDHALFEFHLSSWLSDDHSGLATKPEMEHLAGLPIMCIYGEDETDSLCPSLSGTGFTVLRLKGGHHFDGNYAALVRSILEKAHRTL